MDFRHLTNQIEYRWTNQWVLVCQWYCSDHIDKYVGKISQEPYYDCGNCGQSMFYHDIFTELDFFVEIQSFYESIVNFVRSIDDILN